MNRQKHIPYFLLIILLIVSTNSGAQQKEIAGHIKCEHANFSMEAGYYSDAVKLFEECIKQYDSMPEALYGAAKAYYFMSEYGKSKSNLTVLMTRSGNDMRPRTMLQDASELYAMVEDAEAAGIEMVYVHGGTFDMGCKEAVDSDCEDEERPQHKDQVGNYYIGKYEVTQKQWKAIMGSNPSEFKNCDDCPVENVSWDSIQVFIEKLNRKYPALKFRLPREAEWEYAARGGDKSKDYKYCGSNDADEVAWFDSNAGNKTHPVGQKMPNELGIYDMGGNVWEWCADWFYLYTGQDFAAANTKKHMSHRTDRGGCWQYTKKYVRPGVRGGLNPQEHSNDLGFRLARDVR